MKIKDVMNKDVIVCAPDDSLGSLADMFKKNHISGIPVVDNGKVVGLVSETDLIKLFKIPEFSNDLWLPSPFEIIEIPIRNLLKLEETKKFFETMKLRPVKDIMTGEVHAISSDDDLEDASTMMVKYDVNRLPVIDNDILVGIVARSDIIKGLSESAE
jgi:CBS domain-containing protein